MEPSRYFTIKNWARFQLYKDRTPPWICLYNTLLDDIDFNLLEPRTQRDLIFIWLLYSRKFGREESGCLPYNPEGIARVIGAREPVDLDALAAVGFIVQVDKEPTVQIRTDLYQNDPETNKISQSSVSVYGSESESSSGSDSSSRTAAPIKESSSSRRKANEAGPPF